MIRGMIKEDQIDPYLSGYYLSIALETDTNCVFFAQILVHELLICSVKFAKKKVNWQMFCTFSAKMCEAGWT